MSAAAGGAPRTRQPAPQMTLEEVQRKADKITDESLESTRRMVRIAAETEETGGKTLDMLHAQGDQLKRIDNRMNEVNNDLKASEKHLTNMEKCCGCCTLFWKRHKNYEKTSTYKKAFKAKPIEHQPTTAETNFNAGGNGQQGGYIERITHDAREDEMDSNLGTVHSILGNLKGQAAAMSNELDNQNEILDNLNNKATANNERLQRTDKRTTALLK